MKFRALIDKILFWVLVSLMGLMVINVLWQVASRYLLQSPSSFTDELSRFLLIWVGLLGAGYATGKKLHLAIDLLPTYLNGKQSGRKLNVVINILVGLFAILVLIWGGSNLVYITLILEQPSAALGIPLGYVYTVIPLSGVLTLYYSIHNLILDYNKPLEAIDIDN
ncbi:TRAP transporter small permease [Fulvivirga lutimaris]|uniref:TRAP transporter small permease n=1 Tax=Fulvivirga lutimaris TaxID=1819566 RepID=UPI0012BC5E5A|nr:TRAP transporter small permease [Fulvivirga lutimaris]MTI39196.1 TRAP transporter small permease [Fulvivirga lutimaris]